MMSSLRYEIRFVGGFITIEAFMKDENRLLMKKATNMKSITMARLTTLLLLNSPPVKIIRMLREVGREKQ